MEDALSTIDLDNPADVNLLCRAVTAKWAMSEHVRAQVRAQLPAALASPSVALTSNSRSSNRWRWRWG
jgi:hypothetical protein